MSPEARVYECSAPLEGDAAAALDVARTALVALGFVIETDSGAEMRARGPGMQSNREPALLGASEIRLRVEPSRVAARAVLGGVATLRAFLYLFPPLLGLTLAVGFALSGMVAGWVCFLSVAPWIVLSPFMASAIERRTTRAVDALVRGMAGAPARAT